MQGISLSVEAGEFVSIIGPSGCGKSTLSSIVGGLLRDFEGEVLVNGGRIDGPHRQVGIVFQEESTFPWRTGLRNVELPLEIAGTPKGQREARARELICLVELQGFEHRRPGELSGGMKQRLAIARTLAFQPRIMLMDEPFGSLDEQTRLLLGEKILQIWREIEQTTLLITRNITEARPSAAAHVRAMLRCRSRGAVRSSGSTMSVRRRKPLSFWLSIVSARIGH